MGFKALNGGISVYIWFAVTPCVCLLAGRYCSFEKLSSFLFFYRYFLEFGRHLKRTVMLFRAVGRKLGGTATFALVDRGDFSL